MMIDKKFIIGIVVVITLLSASVGYYVFTVSEDSEIKLTHFDPIHVTSNEELSSLIDENNWKGTGEKGNPFIIENLRIDDTVDVMLYIENTDVHLIVRNNHISNGNTQGILLNNVRNAKIIGNTLTNHTGDGIFVNDSRDILVSENQLTDIKWARFTTNGAVGNFPVSIDVSYSADIVVDSNVMKDCYDGIWTWGEVNSTIVSNNEITTMELHGIGFGGRGSNGITVKNNKIKDVGYGMWFYNAGGESTISGNTISDTHTGLRLMGENITVEYNSLKDTKYGIYFTDYINNYRADYHVVRYNDIMDASKEGVYIENTDFGMVYSNNFIDNNVDNDEPQIYDSGDNNTIDSNYYSDWTSPDTNNDNIVDDPYVIQGASENKDEQPMTKEIEF